MDDDEWVVSLDNPKFTSELRTLLRSAFNRLATLNVGQHHRQLSLAENCERAVLSHLHSDVRLGRGVWAVYADPKA